MTYLLGDVGQRGPLVAGEILDASELIRAPGELGCLQSLELGDGKSADALSEIADLVAGQRSRCSVSKGTLTTQTTEAIAKTCM